MLPHVVGLKLRGLLVVLQSVLYFCPCIFFFLDRKNSGSEILKVDWWPCTSTEGPVHLLEVVSSGSLLWNNKKQYNKNVREMKVK